VLSSMSEIAAQRSSPGYTTDCTPDPCRFEPHARTVPSVRSNRTRRSDNSAGMPIMTTPGSNASLQVYSRYELYAAFKFSWSRRAKNTTVKVEVPICKKSLSRRVLALVFDLDLDLDLIL
jgi:hypothetical protein